MAISEIEATSIKAWPFLEARRLLERGCVEAGRPVLFQTGYGPSGLPHIGTFCEVLRTSMVRRALRELSDCPSRLICFSDDMDALRRVPDNIPNRDQLQEAVGLPLSRVPDPFGEAESFGASNNARLKKFLDHFGFDYEFVSSTERYRSGAFDEMLVRVLEQFDAVQAIMLPTLGPERRATYSPFLPISPKSGRVLQVPTLERHPKRGSITVEIEEGERVEIPVTGGQVKLQWKPDWAMRWVALGVDYEMSGKDLIDSVRDSSRIARALGGRPPVGLSYEHFLDADGQKISKSKGNGLSIEDWLAYAPKEALAYFMFAKPRTAKRLFVEAIPGTVDSYYLDLDAYRNLEGGRPFESPIWHVHAGEPPHSRPPIGFRTLVNLASVTGAESAEALAGFLQLTSSGSFLGEAEDGNGLVEHAVRYALDVTAPKRRWRRPGEKESQALAALREAYRGHTGGTDAESLQTVAYEVGKAEWDSLRGWFQMLYQTLLGQSEGPRFGGFVAVYGIENTICLIDTALAGDLADSGSLRAE